MAGQEGVAVRQILRIKDTAHLAEVVRGKVQQDEKKADLAARAALDLLVYNGDIARDRAIALELLGVASSAYGKLEESLRREERRVLTATVGVETGDLPVTQRTYNGASERPELMKHHIKRLRGLIITQLKGDARGIALEFNNLVSGSVPGESLEVVPIMSWRIHEARRAVREIMHVEGMVTILNAMHPYLGQSETDAQMPEKEDAAKRLIAIAKEMEGNGERVRAKVVRDALASISRPAQTRLNSGRKSIPFTGG